MTESIADLKTDFRRQLEFFDQDHFFTFLCYKFDEMVALSEVEPLLDKEGFKAMSRPILEKYLDLLKFHASTLKDLLNKSNLAAIVAEFKESDHIIGLMQEVMLAIRTSMLVLLMQQTARKAGAAVRPN